MTGGGAPPPHPPALQGLLRHGHSPGALLGLTVTFLPELPARPTLLRWRFLRTRATLCPPFHRVLSRHKDQRSDGFSLSPAALGGGGRESPAQPPLLSGPQALHWTPTAATPPPSLLSLCPLGSCSGGGSWFIPANPGPACCFWAAALQLQPLRRSSLPSLPPPPSLLPQPCLCQVPPLSQAEQPGDRRTMLKAFSQFSED